MRLLRQSRSWTTGLLATAGMVGMGGCHSDPTAALEPASTASANQLGSEWSSGWIAGLVWDDANGDGKPEPREHGLDEVTVYLDTNDNGVRDAGEPAVETNSWGFYLFSSLSPSDYVVRQEVPFGWRNTSGGEGPHAPPAVVLPKPQLPVAKIIGGDETELGEYPFMAAVGLLFDGSFFQNCGGSLITDRWVVTAAHCSEWATPEYSAVLAGTNDLTDGSGRLLRVKQIYLHPDYALEPSEPGEPFSVLAGYDIALWELETPVDLRASGLESVAMLSPENEELAEVGTMATTVGWGVSDLDSVLLQDVHLPIFDDEVCAEVYFDAINFDTQICGGAPEGGIDACQGDSGGPLLVRDPAAELWMLAGITSYGHGCALPGNPGVWARVSELSDWAEATAVEPSRVHRVTVSSGTLAFAEFGNRSTRYEPARPIEPRWQVVNLASRVDAGGVATFDWRILDEADVAREYQCALDPDGLGPLSPAVSVCVPGRGQATIPGFEVGIYLPTLNVSLGATQFQRNNVLVVGEPREVVIAGTLTPDDAVDPDLPWGVFYIDYYAIEGLSYAKAISVQATSNDFEVYVGLYDRDFREANGGGGTIAYFFAWSIGEVAEHTFFPALGTRYLLGVSSLRTRDVGSYTVTVVNDGMPEPTTLNLPQAARLGIVRKLPRQRLKIELPAAP